MKSIGGVAVLHPRDSLNNHPDKSHPAVKFNPNFTDNHRRRTRIHKKNNNRYNTGIIGASEHVDSNSRSEFFAGSVFVESPPPSSVPIPGFFTKSFGSAVIDDDRGRDPTTELRRILGLSLS